MENIFKIDIIFLIANVEESEKRANERAKPKKDKEQGKTTTKKKRKRCCKHQLM